MSVDVRKTTTISYNQYKKHREVFEAWLKGETIETRADKYCPWGVVRKPRWYPNYVEYRVAPKEKCISEEEHKELVKQIQHLASLVGATFVEK